MNEKSVRAQRAMKGLRALDQVGTGKAAGGMGAEATDRLADLDACTSIYRAWSPALIPGLLQTEDYASLAIRSRTPSLPMSEVGVRVRSRVRRTDAFLAHRAHAPAGSYAWFVIGESAINRPLGNLQTHYEQLEHLLELTVSHPNVIIHVLREDPPQPGALEPFSIFTLDYGPVVGHLETVVSGFYTTVAADVARLHSAFADVDSCALSSTAARDYIMEVASACWELISEQSSSSQAIPTPTTVSTSPVLPPAPSE